MKEPEWWLRPFFKRTRFLTELSLVEEAVYEAYKPDLDDYEKGPFQIKTMMKGQ